MAGIFNPSDITFNGKEVQSIGEMIIEEVFAKPTLDQVHTIETGIVAKQQIGYAGRFTGLFGKKETGCEPEVDTKTIGFTQKYWEPQMVEGRLKQCYKDLLPSFWAWSQGKGLKKADLSKGDFANFISERMSDLLWENWLIKFWFSNQQAANYNSSPAGVITNGIDLDYFNIIDGFFEQIFDIITADSDRYTGDISSGVGLATKNGQSTATLQRFNSTDTSNHVVTETLANLKYNADYRMRNKANLQYLVTQSVFDQYSRELRSYNNVQASYERIEGGYTSLMFEGIPVIALDFWDRTIESYENNGTKLNKPHRALLTTKDMLRAGIEEEGNLKEVEIWYEKKEKAVYIDTAASIDAKYSQDFMVQMAY